MGEKKYLDEIDRLFKKSPVVDFSSISRIINNKKKVRGYTKQIVRNLLLNKKIKRLTKGCYTIHEEPSLAVFCFKPSYLGLQDAMSFYNLWEQETIPIIVTYRKIKPGLRKVFGMNVLIRRIDKKYFFGFDYARQGDFYFPVSDVEKTLIDMLYFKQKMDPEVLNNFRKRIDRKKFKSYLKIYPRKFRKRVLEIYGREL